MQMASGARMLATGTIVPNEDTISITINTGVTGWKNFLLVADEMPVTDSDVIRYLGMRYVNIDGDYDIMAFGASTHNSDYPNNVVSHSLLSGYTTINGSNVSFNGIAATIGKMIAGYSYTWYVW